MHQIMDLNSKFFLRNFQLLLLTSFSHRAMATKMSKISSLNDLDNSALMKLFERLSTEDLCTMKGICTRFRLLANKTFKRHHANDIIFENPIENMVHTTRIIKCFGKYITSVTIAGSVAWDLNTSTLQLIAQHCGSKLKKLRLLYFHFDKQTVAVMKTLASKLTIIELLYCSVDLEQHGVNYNVAFKAVENLKEFVIIGGTEEMDLKFLNKKWPALEKVELISVQLTDELILAQMLKKNRVMVHFSYVPNVPVTTKNAWINWFDNHELGLKDLSIELIDNIDYVPLFSRLKYLRRIVISCKGYNKPIHPLVTILSKVKTLEVFSLWNVNFCQLLTMPKLQHVKTLELREMHSVFDRNALVYELSKQWGKVENLYLDHSVVRGAEDLGLFVQNIPQLKDLFLCDMKTFYLLPDTMQFNVWCLRRFIQLHVYVDARFLTHRATTDRQIVFRAIKDRISQAVSVLCSSNLN